MQKTEGNTENESLTLGISSCLLGEKSRYDAAHKRNRYITDVLGKYFRFVSVCPELEIGMGVPRETVDLVGSPESPRLIGTETGDDWTERMHNYARRRVRQTDIADLDGFILKKDSPSCGAEKVNVFHKSGNVTHDGVGLFADRLMEQYPLLPVVEESRLKEIGSRDNFIERVFAYHRLCRLFKKRYRRRPMIDFHEVSEFQLQSHSMKHYRMLGELIERIAAYRGIEFRGRYGALFIEALIVKATEKKQLEVLHRIFGSLKKHLTRRKREHVQSIIGMYLDRRIPLIVPLRLIRHFATINNIDDLARQTFLNPHPHEIKLRYHV